MSVGRPHFGGALQILGIIVLVGGYASLWFNFT